MSAEAEIEDMEDDARTRRRPTTKKESSWGNFLEAVVTYGAGFFIFLPLNLLFVFDPTSWFTPDTDAEKLGFMLWWFVFALAYDITQSVAANIGVKAKFASKTVRLFADFLSSFSPLAVPFLMVILGVFAGYRPNGVDLPIAFFLSWICIADLLGRSNLVHTALRRVREVSTDH